MLFDFFLGFIIAFAIGSIINRNKEPNDAQVYCKLDNDVEALKWLRYIEQKYPNGFNKAKYINIGIVSSSTCPIQDVSLDDERLPNVALNKEVNSVSDIRPFLLGYLEIRGRTRRMNFNFDV